jgi:regulator of sirC expression with transglutaminase-like and TPR domain
MNHDGRRAALAELVAGPVAPSRLGRACLLIACGEQPDLDADACLDAIQEFAAQARPAVEAGAAPWGALQAVLGVAAGFRGDHEHYDAPENSFLDQVLARRRGLPILLSVVWIEVARAAGCPAAGIGLPGHFIVRVGTGDAAALVDPFFGGEYMTEHAALTRAQQATGQVDAPDPRWLDPVDTRAILRRILVNLEGTYARRGDLPRLERTLSDHLIVDPGAPSVLVNRGETRARLGRSHEGLEDLNAALSVLPAGPAFAQVHDRAARIARRTESAN